MCVAYLFLLHGSSSFLVIIRRNWALQVRQFRLPSQHAENRVSRRTTMVCGLVAKPRGDMAHASISAHRDTRDGRMCTAPTGIKLNDGGRHAAFSADRTVSGNYRAS
eukprot:3544498-Pleurochrysis_carterae.AAC.4